MENGVYKIEAVSNNGYAYFNLPISRSQFYSVIAPVSDTDRDILISDLSSVTTSVLASINTVRR